jgi:hypothetical protein
MKMFQPKRPLRPKRKERKKIPVKSLSGQEIKVNYYFNIIYHEHYLCLYFFKGCYKCNESF